MEIVRQKEFVNQYHYDARNLEWEKENGTPETDVEVTFQLVEKNEELNETAVVAVLQFMIVRDEFVLSGVLSQMVKIKDRLINQPSEFSQEEVATLAAPLLDILKRMTYEVTEIALDKEGVSLEF